MATSQIIQKYLDRGDIRPPKASRTTSPETVGKRTSAKAAEVFVSTTERLLKRLRPSLRLSNSGGSAAGSSGSNSQLYLSTPSSGTPRSKECVQDRQVDGNPSVVGGAGKPEPLINLTPSHSYPVT